MDSFNYSKARAQLSMLINKASEGEPVEITRRGKTSVVVISKKDYELYKKIEREAKFVTDRLSNTEHF